MIIHNILKENTFVIIVYKLLVQQKYKKTMLVIALKLMVNKSLKCLKK